MKLTIDHFMMFCRSCGKKHRMMQRKCPTCDVHETPQPVSENVANQCGANYSCDGCMAYREHTNPY